MDVANSNDGVAHRARGCRARSNRDQRSAGR